MRFGISATSSIFPKNFLTRFRPINVCAIMSSRSIDSSGPDATGEPSRQAVHGPLVRGYRGDQDDSPEDRYPSRSSGQASSHPISADSAQESESSSLNRQRFNPFAGVNHRFPPLPRCWSYAVPPVLSAEDQ